MMNLTEKELYQKICNFNLDTPKAVFPFSYKLSWLCRWSKIYTFRVIEEYKKFLFLAMVTDHIVSPSEPIDVAWHLHLLYTKSYWDEFCGEIAKKPLHHSPGMGGIEEEQKYLELYKLTLKSYKKYFGTPPDDIWLSPNMRGEPFRWIDAKKYWLIPNPVYWFMNNVFKAFQK